MAPFDLDAWVARSGALDLDAIPWADVPKYEVPPEAVRTLTYMQDIESHTIIYLRSLLATRAVDDPEVSTFLACWLHEETFHGIALSRFLECAGHPLPPRAQPRGQEPVTKRLESWATSMVSRAWPDFCAVHMTWGAINELTTLTGYLRLKTVARHPVLDELLETIMRDESRHSRDTVAMLKASRRRAIRGRDRSRRTGSYPASRRNRARARPCIDSS